MRIGKIKRKTSETDIALKLNIDGSGNGDIDTGIGILDHMLNLFVFHGSFDLKVSCKGDLHTDTHHTAEDIGIALGQAFYQAIGDKRGINRYSSIYVPMDESLGFAVIDISSRSYLVFNADFSMDRLGDMDTQNFKEFFRAFSDNARVTLHLNLIYGENDHHKIEAMFKAFAKTLKDACRIVSKQIPSTKDLL